MAHELAIPGGGTTLSPLSPTVAKQPPRVHGKLTQGLSIVEIDLDDEGTGISYKKYNN